MQETNEPSGDLFDMRLAAARDALKPAARRVVDFIDVHRAAALASSAVELAASTATSDATVVRAVQALGFAGLVELKRALVAALNRPTTAADGMRRTLDDVGESTDRAIDAVIDAHGDGLAVLRAPKSRAAIAAAVVTLALCPRIAIFGIGPSAALAGYGATQLARSGRGTHLLDGTARRLADQLVTLSSGDGLLAIAYGVTYPEVVVTLEEAKRLAAPTVLLTDATHASSLLRLGWDVVVDIPRGRPGHFALHGATLVALEALILGLSAFDRENAIRTLERLNRVRRRLDDGTGSFHGKF